MNSLSASAAASTVETKGLAVDRTKAGLHQPAHPNYGYVQLPMPDDTEMALLE